MQSSLKVIADYCSNPQNVKKEKLALALRRIVHEDVSGSYLYQLTDYLQKFLFLDDEKGSISICDELGAEIAKKIIESLENMNDSESKQRKEAFVAQIISKFECFMAESFDAHKMETFGQLIVDLFEIANIQISDFQSIASLLYSNIICQKQIISDSFREIAIKIVEKYFKLFKTAQIELDDEIYAHLLSLTRTVFSECRKSFNSSIISLLGAIPNFFVFIKRNLERMTFKKVNDIFVMLCDENSFFHSLYAQIGDDNLETLIRCEMWFKISLTQFVWIWQNEKIEKISDFAQEKAHKFQMFATKKLINLFCMALDCDIDSNKDPNDPMTKRNKKCIEFVTKYFDQIMTKSEHSRIQILKWLKTDNQKNKFCVVWCEYLKNAKIECFDQMIDCLEVSESFCECPNYSKHSVFYCLNMSMSKNKNLMKVIWKKALMERKKKSFWRNLIIFHIVCLCIDDIKSCINMICECAQREIIKANKGNLRALDRCNFFVLILMCVYTKFLKQSNADLSRWILSKFILISDSCHSFFALICWHYPFNLKAAKQCDRDFIKCIIQKVGSSLAKEQKNENAQSLKFENGFFVLSVCLTERAKIAQNAKSNICKLIEQTIKNKLFEKSVNLDLYLSLLRVYAFVHLLLPMSLRTFFLAKSCEFLCLCPDIVQIDICRHLLPNIKWRSAEIDQNKKEFAMQINCIYILFRQCFGGKHKNVICQTTLALKASQKYLPFDASILIPINMKTKIMKSLKRK